MIAAPLATAGWLRWPRLSRSYHLNLSSIVRVKECNLKSIGSLILCTFSLLLAETPPVHLLKEFLKKSLQQKGLLACAPTFKRPKTETSPVNCPDSREVVFPVSSSLKREKLAGTRRSAFEGRLAVWGGERSFERSDGFLQIIPPRGHRPCQARIACVERVRHACTFFLGCNVDLEDSHDAIEIADQRADQCRLLRCCAIGTSEMILVFHLPVPVVPFPDTNPFWFA